MKTIYLRGAALLTSCKGLGFHAGNRMKTVFLTGASGFLGSRCIEPLLKKGYSVIAVSSKPQFIPQLPNLSWIQLNLKNINATQDIMSFHAPSHLLHLAWGVEPPNFWQSSENLEWLKSSIDLIDAFIKSGGKRAVIAGTCAEYQWIDQNPSIKEDALCIPNSLYGSCKYSLFLLAQKISQICNISFSSGRLFHLYGPGEHPKKFIRSVITSILQKKTATYSSGNHVRDYLYIDDAAAAITDLLDSACEGPVNIGSGYSVTINELMQLIGKTTQGEEWIKTNPSRSHPFDPLVLTPSINRLTHELQWSPKVTLEEGVQKTLIWNRNIIQETTK